MAAEHDVGRQLPESAQSQLRRSKKSRRGLLIVWCAAKAMELFLWAEGRRLLVLGNFDGPEVVCLSVPMLNLGNYWTTTK